MQAAQPTDAAPHPVSVTPPPAIPAPAAPVHDRWEGFTRVCHDSRAACPGALFVAIRGTRTDGHRHVGEALARGATGIVIEQGRLGEIPAPLHSRVVAAVKDTRLALAYLAADFHGHPSRRLFTVGVTGTNGKTTVASLVAYIWNSAPVPPQGGGCGFIGTVGIRIGREMWPTDLTTPEAPDLQAALAAMVPAGLRGAVMEVSSQGISHHRIAGTSFAVAALTQITPDHCDIHPSFEAYRDIKLGFLRRQPRGTLLVVNGDDPAALSLVGSERHPERVFTYGAAPGSDLRIVGAGLGPAGLCLHLLPSRRLLAWVNGRAEEGARPRRTVSRPFGAESAAPPSLPWRLVTPLLGRHNGHNVAAAALIALLAGCSFRAVAEGVRRFRAPERRLQLHRLRGRYVLDDTAMNPASYQSGFEAALALGLHHSGGRFILVTAIRGGRGALVNAQNGEVIAAWATRLPLRRIILTESDGNVGKRDRVDEEERKAVEGALRAHHIPFDTYRPLLPALEAAWKMSRPGDGILLFGAQGMDDGWRLLQALASR